jgi:hypothetical protein
MQTLQSPDGDDPAFQSGTYHGRPIAILNRGGRWPSIWITSSSTTSCSPLQKEQLRG